MGCTVYKVPGLNLHRCLVLKTHMFWGFMVHRLMGSLFFSFLKVRSYFFGVNDFCLILVLLAFGP